MRSYKWGKVDLGVYPKLMLEAFGLEERSPLLQQCDLLYVDLLYS